MRKSFRPAWYLPSGAINAADGQLEAASSACERWGLGGAGAVVIAVIAELIIAWIEPPYSTFLADSAIADGIIAIGITVEVVLGTMWNNHIQTELRKRSNKRVEAAEIALGDATRDAGEAKERAAALELELFKLRSPRQLDEKAFKAALEGRPKWPVTEVLYVDASDCVQVAAQIIVALGDAGWDVNGVPTPIRGPNPGCEFPVHLIPEVMSYGGQTTGVSVVMDVIPTNTDAWEHPFTGLIGALTRGFGQASGGRDSSMRPSTLRVVIAPRQ